MANSIQSLQKDGHGWEMLPLQDCSKHLMTSIINNNTAACLADAKQYQEHGVPDYEKLIMIPAKDRFGIMELSDREGHAIVLKMLTAFCANFNVKSPMNELQLVQCSAMMLGEAKDETLSIQELNLFFYLAIRGVFGKVYDRLDIGVMMEMFDKFLNERYRQWQQHKMEKESQYKSYDPPRTGEEKTIEAIKKWAKS